jgi:hypothetical protein
MIIPSGSRFENQLVVRSPCSFICHAPTAFSCAEAAHSVRRSLEGRIDLPGPSSVLASQSEAPIQTR